MRYQLETSSGLWLPRNVEPDGAQLAAAIGEAIAETGPRPDLPPIWETDVVYQDDPEEVWQSPDALLVRGYGDCEDIVRYEGSRLYGYLEPRVRRTGPALWHTDLVDVNGTVWDPAGELQRSGRILPPAGLAGLGWSPGETWARVRTLAANRLKATRAFLREATRKLGPYLKDPAKRQALITALSAIAPQYAAPLQQANQAITQAQQQLEQARQKARAASAEPEAFVLELLKKANEA